MKTALMTLALLAPLAVVAEEQPLSHFEEYCLGQAQGQRCHDYLIGVIDGAKLQAAESAPQDSRYVSRAKRQRMGGRLEHVRARLCEQQTPQREALLAELQQEIAKDRIASRQQLLEHLRQTFSCQP
ncbi:hypothetical protein [Gallaecimonas sp. GXIMD4217]|uniref:hypothetical protein n=1 Tax=Gallaecimonas sp. GXIMD4217 TaxID=3131927 RepID=UPI00311B38AC